MNNPLPQLKRTTPATGRRLGATWLCALFLGPAAHSLRADVTNLIAVADTTLQEAFPNNNLGGGSTILAGGRGQGGSTRGLLRFEIGGTLPAGATVNSATLTLTVTATPFGGGDSVFELHRVLGAWGEGSGSDRGGGTLAQVGEATWNARLSPNTAWTVPGGDFVATASANLNVAGDGSYTFTSAALAADVQFWFDHPTNNFGWLLRSEAETTPATIRRFASRTDLSHPPVLTINYTAPASPLPPTIFGVALTANQIRFSFLAQSNRTYAVEFRDRITNGNWNVLTNIPAQSANWTVETTSSISSNECYFRIRTP